MFSGIIETTGTISELIQHPKELSIIFKAPESFLKGVQIGDSIAVNGACLTVVKLDTENFQVDLSAETLNRTYFLDLEVGTSVNLEKALTLNSLLNGHIVTGHVDGIGQIIKKEESGRSVAFEIAIPENLMRYMAQKGSVCLDGVSLTINSVGSHHIGIHCIPQTLSQTTLNTWRVDSKAHVEVDIMARYVERLLNVEKHDKKM